MPANVPAVSGALAVLPNGLARVFTQSREFAVLENQYPDGSSQRRVQVTNGGYSDILPRLKWKMSRRLIPAKMVELREFYDARKGPAEAFYFYDPYESSAIGFYDPSGASEDGRYVVHFAGEWKQSMGVGRGEASIELVELALAAGSDTMDFSDPNASGLLSTAGF